MLIYGTLLVPQHQCCPQWYPMPIKSQDRITKRMLDALTPTKKDFSVWDSEVRGFGVRIKPSGSKSFILKYRNTSGRQRKFTLGQYGQITVEQARRLAQQHLGKLAGGDDPHKDMQPSAQMTVADLCLQYFADAEAGRVMYRGNPRNHPRLLSTMDVFTGTSFRCLERSMSKT